MICRAFVCFIFIQVLANAQNIIRPRLVNVQRTSLRGFRIRWRVENSTNLSLTRYRIFARTENLTEYREFKEWPSQAVKVQSDGTDAETLQEIQVDSVDLCIKKCAEHKDCRFVVVHYARCFLKDATPSGKCSIFDECYSVKKYYYEAEIDELPLYTTLQLQLQVFDSDSQVWSEMSDASKVLCTNIPQNYYKNNPGF